MNKEEVAKALECSTRQVEKYAHENRLGVVEYVKGKRGRQASYKPEEVERLKGELERERSEVIGQAPAPSALSPRPPASLAQPGALERFAEMIAASVRPADTRPVWLTKAQAVEVSGLPARWIDRAVKNERLKPIGHGHGWRVHRDDVLALAESLRPDGE